MKTYNLRVGKNDPVHCKFLKKGLKSEPKGSKIRATQEIYDFLFT